MTDKEAMDILLNAKSCLWFGKPPCPICNQDHGDPKCSDERDKEIRERYAMHRANTSAE